MTFLQLQYFQTVARVGSIASAAETLSISPASLSKTIHQLEAELGIQLFSREGRRISLNQAGSVFLEYATEILDTMNAARLELGNLTGTIRHVLHVRMDVLLDEPGRIPVELKAIHPEITLDIMPPSSTRGIYDLRFFATSNELVDDNVEHICSERWVAALPATHPLASQHEIRFQELAKTPFILFQDDGHEETFMSMCADANIKPQVNLAFSSHSHGGLHRAISEGLGFSIVPERTWKSEWKQDQVVLVPFCDIMRKRHIYCAHPANRPITEDGRLVIDYISKKLNQA
ncbi:MAG: LysR family transcriptional regulator [Coriobacteriia bacterium]|nr:LysR family transcriptional regulator [Coriobacteriia bacterium]